MQQVSDRGSDDGGIAARLSESVSLDGIVLNMGLVNATHVLGFLHHDDKVAAARAVDVSCAC